MFNQVFPDAVITETSTPSEAVQQLETGKFNLLVIEASNHSTENPLLNIKRIRQKYPDMAILVFSHKDENSLALPVIRAGADGYLLKYASLADFTEAVGSLLKGEKYLSPQLRQKLMNDIITGNDEQYTGANVSLTPREREVLDGLIKGSRISEIASGLGIHNSTVSALKRNILAKMKVQNVIELAEKMKN
ncbi:Oxygen regulatory protein NreC [Dyadobacter sp. CECT 9275]|uniref:Oxygen regulatory protein NreC n=2 Tax=Dyadobacter helix TaxID=2822344 RepID=A0A916JI54_9BACT|nr:Oxygen regulatory protein NreC [Dyadobacter sp. CECT 9275]